MIDPTLIIFSGLPGTGKTTLSRKLAAHTQKPLLAIDTLFEIPENMLACADPFWESLIHILLAFTEDQLALGLSVIVDSVFMGEDREQARQLAIKHKADFKAIHAFNSDERMWEKRLTARQLQYPEIEMASWASVQEQRKDFWPWDENNALFADSADPVEVNFAKILAYLDLS